MSTKCGKETLCRGVGYGFGQSTRHCLLVSNFIIQINDVAGQVNSAVTRVLYSGSIHFESSYGSEFPDYNLAYIPFVPPREYRNICLKCAMTASFMIQNHFSFNT
jgi:hypothetical protein